MPLFLGSIRQNILFGQPMDRPRYNAVVKRCALDRDFSLFAHGDKTIVGERGVSLSGGKEVTLQHFLPNYDIAKRKGYIFIDYST